MIQGGFKRADLDRMAYFSQHRTEGHAIEVGIKTVVRCLRQDPTSIADVCRTEPAKTTPHPILVHCSFV